MQDAKHGIDRATVLPMALTTWSDPGFRTLLDMSATKTGYTPPADEST